MEQVIIVDEGDRETGTMEKIEAHRQGRLHRAFSVFVFNAQGDLLLQKRAETKYHCGGLWTNTCDGHPRPGEDTVEAARRRLREELGFECELKETFTFRYHAGLDHDLIEHEVDHVLIGHFDGHPNPDPAEASDWKWIGMKALAKDMQERPEQYAPWSRIAVDQLTAHVRGSEKPG